MLVLCLGKSSPSVLTCFISPLHFLIGKLTASRLYRLLLLGRGAHRSIQSAIDQQLQPIARQESNPKPMLDSQVRIHGPYIDSQDLEQESYCDPLHTDPSEIWSSLGVHSMADEIFQRGYPEAMYQDPSQQHMSNMQRFMEETETYYAGRRVNDVKQAHFNAENLLPTAAGCHVSPNPWPHHLNIPQAIYPQQPWNPEWTASDPESSSAETGNTWSPRATESCPDQDAQYPSWREAQVYPIGPPYLDSGSSFAHGAGVSGPQSVTGALSEIQQSPDNEADFVSTGELMRASHRGCPDTSTRQDMGTTDVHGDECLGSSVNGSAAGSPFLRMTRSPSSHSGTRAMTRIIRHKPAPSAMPKTRNLERNRTPKAQALPPPSVRPRPKATFTN